LLIPSRSTLANNLELSLLHRIGANTPIHLEPLDGIALSGLDSRKGKLPKMFKNNAPDTTTTFEM
jgi:hypothetical protein